MLPVVALRGVVPRGTEGGVVGSNEAGGSKVRRACVAGRVGEIEEPGPSDLGELDPMQAHGARGLGVRGRSTKILKSAETGTLSWF